MKLSRLYRIFAVIIFCLSSIGAYAQVTSAYQTIQLDTFSKIFGILITIGGFVMAYIQLRMANKMALLEAKVTEKIREEIEKLEVKIQLASKEIEAKMATHHDIDNLRTVMNLHHEIAKQNSESLKEQLKTAANIYKRDRE